MTRATARAVVAAASLVTRRTIAGCIPSGPPGQSENGGTELKPLGFVPTPAAASSAASGRATDFEVVYTDLNRPAIEASGMEPFRAGDGSAGEVRQLLWLRDELSKHFVGDVVRHTGHPVELAWSLS
jgi:hypothetical protein